MPQPPQSPPVRRTTALLLVLALIAGACFGGDDDSDGGSGEAATLVETSAICEAEALISAVALGAEQGTLAGMADDPVATAAANNPILTTLVEAIEAAQLVDTLNNAESVTVFAPTDCAFAAVDPATLDAALADPSGLLTQVLGFHVIPGQQLSSDELTGGALQTFSGQTLNYINDGQHIILDGQAQVVVPDIQTANATVHLVDAVMMPGQGGQDAVAEDGTAPGSPAPADPTRICDTDGLMAAVEGGTAEGTLSGMADDPVAVAASNNPVLTTLVEAVVAASLVDALNTADALTVFAPTDCAFAALDPATLESALADPSGLLTQVLGFHVVPGQRLQFEDLTGGELPTFTGASLPYTNEGNVVTLNDQARIVVPNIQTANATVHLIDAVLIPPS